MGPAGPLSLLSGSPSESPSGSSTPTLSRMICSPASAPQKTTSMPSSRTPACLRIGASCAPAQRALPTPPWKNGRPVLPEHSRVKSTSRRGRPLRSSSVSVCGRVDQAADLQPPVGRRQPRLVVVVDDEEVVGRREPGVELLPHQLDPGWSVGWSSHGRTSSSPGCPGNACAGPATFSTVSPANAAPPPFNRVRRSKSCTSIGPAPLRTTRSRHSSEQALNPRKPRPPATSAGPQEHA